MKISEVDRYQASNIKQNRNINLNQQRTIAVKNSNAQNPAFKGPATDVAFKLLDQGFKVLDKNAMIQVAFVDSVATDIPRTLVDLKTGLAAALETMRREFSGLIVNCLIPGVIVKMVAKALPKPQELAGTNVAGSWANGSMIDNLSGVYKSVQNSNKPDKTRAFVEQTLSSLEGLDGTDWVKYASKSKEPKFQEAVSLVTEAISKSPKERKTLLSQAKANIAELTKAESILKFNGMPQANLEDTLRDIADMGSNFEVVKKKTLANIGATAGDMAKPEVSSKVVGAIEKYSKSLTGIVNKKSLIGLGIVIALAVSVQKINRAITRKQFNAEGAPIYKDFGKKDTSKKMDEKEKKVFFGKKMVAALGMYAMAAISMMKKPTLGMFQFSGIFPTLDQCRWIASSTFASRMLAAEDENELRESTVRDIASFAGLYFLGDYVKKSVASAFEALSKTKKGAKLVGENVVLLNRKKVIDKPANMNKITSKIAYRAKVLGNWIKNTELKSASEVASTKVGNLRNLCRVADIAFSIVMLGILLPRYNRKVTEKKVAEAKKQEELQKQASMKLFEMPEVFKDVNIV